MRNTNTWHTRDLRSGQLSNETIRGRKSTPPLPLKWSSSWKCCHALLSGPVMEHKHWKNQVWELRWLFFFLFFLLGFALCLSLALLCPHIVPAMCYCTLPVSVLKNKHTQLYGDFTVFDWMQSHLDALTVFDSVHCFSSTNKILIHKTVWATMSEY